MATLQQTLRGLPEADDQLSRGPGGTLQRTKKLQQAVKDTGVATAPTTPLGAQMIGADAQASKMAGTPQQMQATLQTALRRKQYGREPTAEETAGMAKSVDMQKLGGLGDRVQSMVDSEAAKLKAPTLAAAVQGQPAVPTAPTVQVGTTVEAGKYADKLAVIRANPESQEAMDAMAEISKDLGKDAKDIDWNKMFQDAGTSIGTAAASTIMNAEDLPVPQILQDIGYSLPELSQLLGVPESTIQGYNIKQLQDKINEVSTAEFSRTQQLEQQAASPLVGAAQRGLAREAAREFSATGVRATEADMQRLNESIAQADMVSFPPGTPERPIAEALADDEISALIKEVVESKPNSKLRRDLKISSPEFYAFIEGNEIALKEAASRIDTAGSKFKQAQEAKAEARKATKLSDEVLDKIEYTPETPTNLTTYINSVPEQDRQGVSDQVNSAVADNLISAEELNALTPEEISELKIGKVDGPWDRLIKREQDRRLFTKAGSPQEQLKYILKDGQTIDDVNSLVTVSKSREGLGLPQVDISFLDLNKDGLPDWDNLNTVYNTIINPKINLKDAGKEVQPISVKKVELPQISPVEQSLVDKFKQLISKGSISAGDLMDTPMTLQEAQRLSELTSTGKAKVDPEIHAIAKSKKDTPERFRTMMITLSADKVGKEIKHVPAVKGLVENYKQLGNYTDREYWKEAINNQVVDWLKTSARARQLGASYSMYQTLAGEGLLSEAAINEFRKIYTNIQGTGKPLVYDQTLNKGLGGYKDW